MKTSADALAAGKKLCDLLALDYAFVTLDSDGMALVRPDGTGEILPPANVRCMTSPARGTWSSR